MKTAVRFGLTLGLLTGSMVAGLSLAMADKGPLALPRRFRAVRIRCEGQGGLAEGPPPPRVRVRSTSRASS